MNPFTPQRQTFRPDKHRGLVSDHKGQQGQMTRPLNLPGKFALTARTVASLTARLDLPAFADIPRECLYVFVIEALAFGTVGVLAAWTPPPESPPAAAPLARA